MQTPCIAQKKTRQYDCGQAGCLYGEVSLRELTARQAVAIIANMDKSNDTAVLITRTKRQLPNGGIVEMVIWQVPVPVPPTTHGFKYRLVYIVDGRRAVGFDNERGKGDHMHLGGQEFPYHFTTIDQLAADFAQEIKKRGAL